MGRYGDLTGIQFGFLAVLRPVEKKNYWRCRCECGNERDYFRGNLTSGHTRSCGCKTGGMIAAKMFKHGQSNQGGDSPITAEYQAWVGMKSRCNNPNIRMFHRYGGRGIKVCDRWMNSFEDFLADMGPKPSPDHSIDRIDNDGDYELDNCRWATKEQQSRNRGNVTILTFQGETMTLAEWAKHSGVDRHTLKRRIEAGWSMERALTAPPWSRLKPTGPC